jgi:hypothetical protein
MLFVSQRSERMPEELYHRIGSRKIKPRPLAVGEATVLVITAVGPTVNE